MVPIHVSSFRNSGAPANVLQNAFSEALLDHGFNFYQMFAIDLLHDFELGVWKSVFKHLIQMLYACGNEKVQTLNER